MIAWVSKWQMEFNPHKCTSLHFGRKNDGFKYSITLNGENIQQSYYI